MIRKVVIFFLFLLQIGIALGQKNDSTARIAALSMATLDANSPDLESQLISLDTIIAIAISHSPYIKYDSMMVNVQEKDITLAKRRWQNYIQAMGNYSTGNQHFITTGTGQDAQNNLFNGYRIGVNMLLPIGEITTRKTRIALEKAEMQAYIHKKDQTKLELTKQVTAEYNNLIAAQRILKIKTVARENALVLQQLADKQFHEGTTSLYDYATVSDLTNDAEADYELAKSSFNSLYKQFEDLVGVELTSLMKKK